MQVLFQDGKFQWVRLENLIQLAKEGSGSSKVDLSSTVADGAKVGGARELGRLSGAGENLRGQGSGCAAGREEGACWGKWKRGAAPYFPRGSLRAC